jgi:hypothetical protein
MKLDVTSLDGASAGSIELSDEVFGLTPRADLDQRVFRHAELGHMRLGLDLGGSEMAAHRLRHVLDLGRADAQLQRDIAVAVLRALRDDLAIVDAQHRHGHMITLLGEDAAHTELPRDQAGAHSPIP